MALRRYRKQEDEFITHHEQADVIEGGSRLQLKKSDWVITHDDVCSPCRKTYIVLLQWLSWEMNKTAGSRYHHQGTQPAFVLAVLAIITCVIITLS